MIRLNWDEYFIEVARSAARRSTCPRRSVGAVVVDVGNRICSTGYNGSLPMAEHCDTVGCLVSGNRCIRTVHAEDNALRYAKGKAKAARIYSTDFPCIYCAKLIVKSGVVEVIYDKPYKPESDDKVLALFHENSIVCRRPLKSEYGKTLVAIPD